MSLGRIAVLGAGGHSKVVIATAMQAGFEVGWVLDDRSDLWGSSILGNQINGPIEKGSADGLDGAVVAVGDNADRKRIVERVNAPWIVLVHPAATVDVSAKIEPGTVVFAHAVIQPEAHIGAHCIVNTGATIDHDCKLGEFAHAGPGAHIAGGTRIGAGSSIGTGAAITPGLSVGAWSTVGAGAAVVGDIPDGSRFGGVPARELHS